jgi:hypothetical protein
MVLLVSLQVPFVTMRDFHGFCCFFPFICHPSRLSLQDVFLCSGAHTPIPLGIPIEAMCRSMEGYTCSVLIYHGYGCHDIFSSSMWWRSRPCGFQCVCVSTRIDQHFDRSIKFRILECVAPLRSLIDCICRAVEFVAGSLLYSPIIIDCSDLVDSKSIINCILASLFGALVSNSFAILLTCFCR